MLETQTSIVYLLSVVALLGCLVYRKLNLHPLGQVPGPRLWAISRLPYIYSLCRGTLVRDVQRLHSIYGPVVRLAPDEVSFATGEAWQRVHGQSQGRAAFPLDKRWFSKASSSEASSIRTAIHPPEHARIRHELQRCFTERAVAAQEPLIQMYLDRFIDSLRRCAADTDAHRGGIVDLVDYYNYFAFDVIGDLCYAQSFNCLETSTYHPWVAYLYEHIRASAFLAITRFYPYLARHLKLLIPKSILTAQNLSRQTSAEKIQYRLNLEMERNDLFGHIFRHDHTTKGLSIPEIEATFHVILTAGSHTTSHVLSGITYFLLRSSDTYTKLTDEIRSRSRRGTHLASRDVEDLPYLNATINEGMRLCTPHPSGNPRMTPAGGATVCGFELPGETTVSMNQWTIFRNRTSFHAADTFAPERWLPDSREPTSPFYNDRLSDVLPFGMGPRKCPGQKLAWVEMRLSLARLLMEFDILPAPGKGYTRWEDQKTYFMVQRAPVWAKLQIRKA